MTRSVTLGLLLATTLAGLVLWRQRATHTAPRSRAALPELEASQGRGRAEPTVLEAPAGSLGSRARVQVCGDEPPPEVLDVAEPLNRVVSELWDRARWLTAEHDRASPELRRGLIELYRRDGDPEEALALLSEAPDAPDDFDVLTAARVTVATRTLRRDPANIGASLLQLGERGPLPSLIRALAADKLGDADSRVRFLEEAHRQAPDEPAWAAHVALAQANRGSAVEALRALRAYEAMVPDDPWPATVLRRWMARARQQEQYVESLRDGVRLRYARDTSVDVAALHLDLLAALDEAAALTGTSRRPQLTMVLYPNAAAFRAATCGPSWSGGLFDGVLHIPEMPADRSNYPRLRRRVRHEALHAQLHHVAPGAPVWLHEGLAQRLEGRPTAGLQRSLTRIQRDGSYIPFPSIEGSFVVIDDRADARFAYHQSYAMVQALIDRHGTDAIQMFVQYLNERHNPQDLLEQVSPPFDGDQLLEWVASHSRPH